MELYKILKTRKGEKNHLKEWITKKKKKKNEGNEWKTVTNLVDINLTISINTLSINCIDIIRHTDCIVD